MPHVTIARDLALTLLAGVFWFLDRRIAGGWAQPRWVELAVAIMAGVMTAVVGFLIHEWSHLAGASVTKSRVHYPNRLLAPLLFHFDTTQNDRTQFLAMSYGGYLGSAIGVAAILLFAPLGELSGLVALGLASLGMIVTFIAEVPTTVRVLRGAPLPSGYAFVPPK